MDSLVSGDKVEHPDYGYGEITLLVGSRAVVNFSGEKIEVDTEQLSATSRRKPPVIANPSLDGNGLISFRRAFEAVNIGVVPPDPGALRDLTIEGDASTREIGEWLSGAYTNGLCKAVFGFYGAGKSHFLHLAKMTALESGWVVSYLEFDPKAADPAKAHLVYQSLMANLEFPARANGDIAKGFTGLIREARESWERVRDLRLFRASPWFLKALEVLLYYPHSDDQDYLDACLWVAGDGGTFSVMRQLARDQGLRPGFVPAMPRTRETAEIYTMHLAVVAEMCRALGYQGLLLILDEAEHVRGYNVRRQERANNFFDLLARCAHRPVSGDAAPILND